MTKKGKDSAQGGHRQTTRERPRISGRTSGKQHDNNDHRQVRLKFGLDCNPLAQSAPIGRGASALEQLIFFFTIEKNFCKIITCKRQVQLKYKNINYKFWLVGQAKKGCEGNQEPNGCTNEERSE